VYAWPINPKPYAEELLSSWFIRLSIANSSDPVGLAGAIWGDWRAWTLDIDRVMPVEKLAILSKVSGVSVKDLQGMTLQPTLERILNRESLNPNQFWSWVIPLGHRNRTRINGLHFCSQCLNEPRVYFKKPWRLAWNTVCPDHNILLSISCPDCGTVISPHLVTYDSTDLVLCVSCKNNLSTIPQIKVHSDVVDFQLIVNDILSDKFNSEYPLGATDYRDFFDILHYLLLFLHKAYRKLVPFQLLFSALDLNIDDMNFSHPKGATFEKYPVMERYYLMMAVSRLLKLSKTELIELLVECGITKQMFNVSDKRSVIIDEIHTSLFNNERSFGTRNVNRTIKARSKFEVDALMRELEPFL